MEFLRLLEGLRTPAGDAIFSVITLLGEETIFIAAGLFFFWCMNKNMVLYIVSRNYWYYC